ncbi:MAG: acylphosphatase [Bacteroidia bacterium]|nr:acylphosphatase [Bacteroidia bacterium]
MQNNLQIIVSGKVQGVFFRKCTMQKANELNLKGFVANQKDGSVKIIACGEAENLDALILWCNTGSPGSLVEKVEVKKSDTGSNYKKFEISWF